MEIFFQQFEATDLDRVCSLISAAMNADEGRYAGRSLSAHFNANRLGLDDGRRYNTLWVGDAGRFELAGICGLHHYDWGPEDTVWLAWFALDPAYQKIGLGRRMLEHTLDAARQSGYRQLFVETYSSDEFSGARSFYQHCGLQPAGQISGYLGSHNMMVYRAQL